MALWLPDSRFEAPELFIPGRKPTAPVTIDWQHPLANGLQAIYLFNSVGVPRNLAAAKNTKFDISTVNDMQFGGYDSQGAYWNDTGTLQRLYINGGSDINLGNKHTVSVVCAPSTNGDILFARNGSYGLYFADYITVYTRPTGFKSWTVPTWSDNDLLHATVTREGDSSWLYFNGVNKGEVTGLGTGDFTWHNLVGYPSSNGFAGKVYVQAVWNRCLTTPEALAFQSNPYQFLIPA